MLICFMQTGNAGVGKSELQSDKEKRQVNTDKENSEESAMTAVVENVKVGEKTERSHLEKLTGKVMYNQFVMQKEEVREDG